MNEVSVQKQSILFVDGQINAHDEESTGQSSVVTDRIKVKMKEDRYDCTDFY